MAGLSCSVAMSVASRVVMESSSPRGSCSLSAASACVPISLTCAGRGMQAGAGGWVSGWVGGWGGGWGTQGPATTQGRRPASVSDPLMRAFAYKGNIRAAIVHSVHPIGSTASALLVAQWPGHTHVHARTRLRTRTHAQQKQQKQRHAPWQAGALSPRCASPRSGTPGCPPSASSAAAAGMGSP